MHRNQVFISAVALVAIMAFANSGFAHFLWLVPTDESGSRVQLYFSEGPEPGNASLLSKLAGLKANAYRSNESSETCVLALSNEQSVLGAVSRGASAWHLVHTYGVHGTDTKSLLIYSAISVTCERIGMEDKDSVQLPNKGFTARPTFDGKKLSFVISQDGKPAKDLAFEFYSSKEHRTLNTDDQGMAAADNVGPGVAAVRFLKSDETAGEHQGASFQATKHYTTISFIVPNLSVAIAVPEEKESLGPLPEAITSFGAAVNNNAFYAFGGNTGSAHSYSNDQQFNKLIKLDTKNNKGWEEIAQGARVQGNALVSYGSSVILVGGFTATNAKGEKGNLVSQADVQQYDLTTGKWSDLPKLPEPRSSMDAIELNGYLYAIGGWNMRGNSNGTLWHETAWRLPLKNPSAGWEPIAQPPFQRRAVAVAAHKDRVIVIGGMNEDGETTTETCVYDPKTNTWGELAPIAGVPLTGFGTSACNVGKDLIVSTVDGAVQRFNDERQVWEIIGQIPSGRFFHRILPVSDHAFAVIGGANMSVGKFKDTLVVRLARP